LSVPELLAQATIDRLTMAARSTGQWRPVGKISRTGEIADRAFFATAAATDGDVRGRFGLPP
jgi:hypothetical protein